MNYLNKKRKKNNNSEMNYLKEKCKKEIII